MSKVILLLVFFILPLHHGAAQTKPVAQWNNTLSQVLEQNPFQQVGKSVFSFLLWDIYESQLATTTGSYPVEMPNQKVLFEIHYFKAISAQDLVQKTVEQWQHLNITSTRYSPYLAELERIWPNIKENDTLTLVMSELSSAFYYNNNLVGVIESNTFGPLFLAIWLSEDTSEPGLRSQLLGNK